MTNEQINKILSLNSLFQIPVISSNCLVPLGVQDSSELIWAIRFDDLVIKSSDQEPSLDIIWFSSILSTVRSVMGCQIYISVRQTSFNGFRDAISLLCKKENSVFREFTLDTKAHFVFNSLVNHPPY